MNPGSLFILTILNAAIILLLLVIIKQIIITRNIFIHPSKADVNGIADRLILPVAERLYKDYERHMGGKGGKK